MALSDNRAKIQALIDSINALPGGGSGGGGGLPDGISKLASGTVTVTVDLEGAYVPLQIWHNMGVVPNYIFVYDTFDYSETPGVNAFVFATLYGKRYKNEGVDLMYYPAWTSAYYDSDGNAYFWGGGSSWEDGNAEYDINDAYFNLYPAEGPDAGWFKTGHTYRWIAAVIDNFN